jgi:pyruvate dehydrogenase E1 component alpha subunit
MPISLIDDYRAMLRIRRFERRIEQLVAEQRLAGTVHLYMGQEAVAVGVAGHLRPTDPSFGAHRSHSHFLALGGSIDELMAEVLGKVAGCSRGFGGSMHLRDASRGLMGTVPIVAATVPMAVGAALAMKLDGGDSVAVSFLGDGAMGRVYRARQLSTGRAVAIKVLHSISNATARARLHREMQIIASLDHPAIVRLIDSVLLDDGGEAE